MISFKFSISKLFRLVGIPTIVWDGTNFFHFYISKLFRFVGIPANAWNGSNICIFCKKSVWISWYFCKCLEWFKLLYFSYANFSFSINKLFRLVGIPANAWNGSNFPFSINKPFILVGITATAWNGSKFYVLSISKLFRLVSAYAIA